MESFLRLLALFWCLSRCQAMETSFDEMDYTFRLLNMEHTLIVVL